MFQIKFVEKIKTRICIQCLSSEDGAVYEIISKHLMEFEDEFNMAPVRDVPDKQAYARASTRPLSCIHPSPTHTRARAHTHIMSEKCNL